MRKVGEGRRADPTKKGQERLNYRWRELRKGQEQGHGGENAGKARQDLPKKEISRGRKSLSDQLELHTGAADVKAEGPVGQWLTVRPLVPGNAKVGRGAGAAAEAGLSSA